MGCVHWTPSQCAVLSLVWTRTRCGGTPSYYSKSDVTMSMSPATCQEGEKKGQTISKGHLATSYFLQLPRRRDKRVWRRQPKPSQHLQSCLF